MKNMYQFFVEDTAISEQMITITGSDVNHIKNVLRMKPGEKVRISSKSGQNYFCELVDIGELAVTAKILKDEAADTE